MASSWSHRWSDRGTDYSIDEFGVVTEHRAESGLPSLPASVHRLPSAVSRELARFALAGTWIRFDEQRPEAGEYVVVFDERSGQAQTEAAFHHEWRAIGTTEEPLARTRRGRSLPFTHWRRLPDPPRSRAD